MELIVSIGRNQECGPNTGAIRSLQRRLFRLSQTLAPILLLSILFSFALLCFAFPSFPPKTISGINPATFSEGMISWFPLFFPLRVRSLSLLFQWKA